MPETQPQSMGVCRAAEFYVGYLRMPPGLLRVYAWLTPSLLAAALALAWLMSRAQDDPGAGVWDTGVARTFTGYVAADPYPHLRIIDPDQGDAVETLMLVEIGKFGGGQRAAPLTGQVAAISGWVLERDGRRMLEMEPSKSNGTLQAMAPGALPMQALKRLQTPNIAELGHVTLRGEIVDSKCYLGAMKPGAGKTHKECATLCIAGGIPPMFVTFDARGQRTYYLLTDAQGRALGRDILPFVADVVELTGMLEQRDDLLLLRIEPASIRRL